MPEITVNGVSIAYEIFGTGPPVVLTPGGWAGRQRSICTLMGRLSRRFRVLIYDRRNCAQSETCIQDTESEFHLWAMDIHALLTELHMAPAYVCGESLGQSLSLLFAHLYPEDTKGLVLFAQPDDNMQRRARVAEMRYHQLAKDAEEAGMQNVIERLRVTSAPNPMMQPVYESMTRPASQERLLMMNPIEFSSIMRKWGEWFTTDRIFVSRLSDSEVMKIGAPALIVPGLDVVHPLCMSEELHRLLPASQLVDYADHLSTTELKSTRDGYRKAGPSKDSLRLLAAAHIVEQFIEEVEGRA